MKFLENQCQIHSQFHASFLNNHLLTLQKRLEHVGELPELPTLIPVGLQLEQNRKSYVTNECKTQFETHYFTNKLLFLQLLVWEHHPLMQTSSLTS